MTEKRYIEGVRGFDDYDVWDNETEQGLSHTEVVLLLNIQELFIKEQHDNLLKLKEKSHYLQKVMVALINYAEYDDYDSIIKAINAVNERLSDD